MDKINKISKSFMSIERTSFTEKYLRSNKNIARGITLVSLVITMIVLIILAAVSMSLINGDANLFGRAKQAGDEYALAAEHENQLLTQLNGEIDSYIGSRDINKQELMNEINQLIEEKLANNYFIIEDIGCVNTTTASVLCSYDSIKDYKTLYLEYTDSNDSTFVSTIISIDKLLNTTSATPKRLAVYNGQWVHAKVYYDSNTQNIMGLVAYANEKIYIKGLK